MEKTRVRVAKNVRNLRLRRKLSQQQLSDISGVPKSTLNHIESASSAPSIEAVEALAQALGVSIEEIASGPAVHVAIRKQKSMPETTPSKGVTIKRILPDPLPKVDFYFCKMKPSATFSGYQQTATGKKLIFPVVGDLILRIEGKELKVEEGGSAIFSGDVAHSISNPSVSTTLFIKVHFYGLSSG